MSTPSIDLPDCPEHVADFVRRALDAVRASVGIALEFDSDTLPLLDHYLRQVDKEDLPTAALVAAMAGSYFGEAVRQSLGGRWKAEQEEPDSWRLVLPSGLSFAPVAMALAAIIEDETGPANPGFAGSPALMQEVEATMERMGNVTAHEYYALSCRFDVLEHLQEVLLAVAADRAAKQGLN